MKKRYQVVLKMGRMSVPNKVKKAKFIVTSMTGNAFFTTPNPALSVITTDANNLEAAAAAAEGGGIKLTADMNGKTDILMRDLNTLAAYVEQVSNTAANLPNAVAIITSAGMEVKATHSHGPTKFQAELTGVAGEVKLRIAFLQGVIYHWQMMLAPPPSSKLNSESPGWTEIGVSRKGSFIQGGLESGTRYSFRVAIEDNSGLGPWTDPVSIMIP